MLEKLKNSFLKSVTIEPTLIFYFTSINMSKFLGYNLLLRKACDPYLTHEPDLTQRCLREIEAQHRVANINTWKALFITLLPMMFLLIAGPWSDHHGKRRRPLIFIPVIGQIITDLCCTLNAYYWNWSPEVAAIFEIIGPGLSGSETCLIAGAVCYLSDISSEKSRTMRISIIALLYLTCGPIGAGIAGIINVKLGFIGSFLIAVLLNSIALVLGFVFIKDTSVPYDKSKVSLMKNVSLQNLYSSVKILTKKRSSYQRMMLNLSLLIRAMVISRFAGESTVLYLFVRRKFDWNEINYSIYTAYKLGTILIGTLFSIGFLCHYLKIRDALIGIVSTVVDTVAAFLYLIVAAPWQMFVIPIVDMFNGAAFTLATSISTKCVESNELGKMNTMQAVMSALLPIAVCPLYSQVYSFTFEKYPSMFFIISVLLSIPTIILFTIVYNAGKKRELKELTTGVKNAPES